MKKRMSRRDFLKGVAAASGAAALAACTTETVKETVIVPGTPEVVEKVVKETVVVPGTPEVVEKVVKETVVVAGTPEVVEKVVTQEVEVEKVVTATPAGPQVGGAVVSTSIEPLGLDPCDPWFLGGAGGALIGLCYDDWTIIDRDGKRQPYLAKAWTRPDPETVIFEIQEGVKFHHSGREMTAEDVVWNVERWTSEELGCAGSQAHKALVESVKALDKYKFEVKLKTPNLLVGRIPLPRVVDRDYLESYREPIMIDAEAGTGPWILDDWVAGTYISFRRNPDYWNKPPLLEEFSFQIMPEERAATAAMRAGQLNFLSLSKYENWAPLQEEPQLNTSAEPGLLYRRLNVNHYRPAMQDENVLQALRYGLNRQQFVDTLSNGLGAVSGPLSPSVSLYALPTDELNELQKYDPELAKSYLRKAGYDEEENRLQLLCVTPAGYWEYTNMAQVTQANLAEIGIDMEIRIQELGVWTENRITLKEYDLSPNDHNSGGFDPDFFFYRSDQSEQDWTGGQDPELDNLIDASNIEEDEGKRRELAQDIQRRLIENVRELYLYVTPVFEAISKDFIGYKPWPGFTNLRVFDWEQVYMGG